MPFNFDTSLEFLKGVGPQKAMLLKKELALENFRDLLHYYPFRHEDRTQFHQISEIHGDLPYIQIKGHIHNIQLVGPPRKKRLIAYINDGSGDLELVWFKGAQWVSKKLQGGMEYVVFGKPKLFGRKLNIAHPEFEPAHESQKIDGYLHPIYSTTERLKSHFLDSKGLSRLQAELLPKVLPHIPETLPVYMMKEFGLIARTKALKNIHFPESTDLLEKARFRLKFEELFYVQLRLLKTKQINTVKFKGEKFDNSGMVNGFYHKHLPFELTGAQKRVIKEIYRDLRTGSQMNRLLQGDVGSGKTMVAFIAMLIAISNGAQTAMMAPTEILAEQHYNGLKVFADKMKIPIVKLTGSTKQSERKLIHRHLRDGYVKIIVGTHALLEEVVQFQNLGLAVVDEQHRFGVAQRAKLWNKNEVFYPHVLVMTATPIPRTLAMTLYGDLDVSVIDELPLGRKPIKTTHFYDSHRLKVFGFIRKEIELGRQIYIVYPLIEESEKLDLKNLEDGYESICRAFPEYPISLVHGRMKSEAKEYEMQRFVRNETKIMVATTVIEVGVDVPNASVMIIENAERFGLAQLHQLRGRVGRGGEQSYCLLMTNFKISTDGKTRIETMVRTTNGFEIADVDLKLRGPGDLMGTQQSGVLDLSIADLGTDGKILQVARDAAKTLLNQDPEMARPENINIRRQVEAQSRSMVNWSRVS